MTRFTDSRYGLIPRYRISTWFVSGTLSIFEKVFGYGVRWAIIIVRGRRNAYFGAFVSDIGVRLHIGAGKMRATNEFLILAEG